MDGESIARAAEVWGREGGGGSALAGGDDDDDGVASGTPGYAQLGLFEPPAVSTKEKPPRVASIKN